MRESLRRLEPLSRSLLVVMLMYNASCPPSGTTVNVPAAADDPKTPPVVVLDVHYPQGQYFTVTPAGHPAAMPTHLNGNDELSLVASCTDNDSGCRNIQIYVEAVTTAANGSMASVGLSRPLAENLDANAAPGGTASPQRAVSVTLNVPQLRGSAAVLTLPVAVYATNAHGAVASIKRFSLFWTEPAPLKLPPCPGFLPAGDPPPPSPEVLDSRTVTVKLQDLKAADPTRTSFIIGVLHPLDPTIAWNLMIAEVAGMAPTTAVFNLDNKTGSSKQLRTFASCNTAGQLRVAAPGTVSADITVTSSDTTTVLLSRARTGPLDVGVEDIAIWNEASFWPAFGGKRTTITWVQ
jgi:hypothetical protein